MNWLSYVVVFGLCGMSAIGNAQTPGALELEVHVPFPSVRLSGTLPVSIVWTNRSSSQRIALRGQPGPSVSGGLTLYVINNNGQSRAITSASRLTLEEVVSGSERIELLPGHGHGIAKRLRVSELFAVPGRYRLEAHYQSPLPTPSNPSVTPGVVEGSNAVASSVEIEVLP